MSRWKMIGRRAGVEGTAGMQLPG